MPYTPTSHIPDATRSAAQTLALTPEQIEEMGKRRLKGESYSALARAYGVQIATATKHIKRWVANQSTPENPPPPAPPPARSTAQHIGRPQEEPDPLTTQLVNNPIQSENKEQSYRENLLWACQAAGAKLRTGNRPNSCPNDKAFFLYQLACENQKDFMTKFSQVETKEKDDAEEKKKKKSTEFILSEIESQLTLLDI